jgi:NAD(P)-dependent dehydrogenase (short-subunit alcohol dehydrogenase family)
VALPENPRAVVTGAGGGLGRAFCLQLARRNARILASDVDLATAQSAVANLGIESHAMRCDVSKVEEVEALATEVERRWGGVDLVINNAGVGVMGDVGEIPIENWQWIIGVNMWGPINGCHVFAPRLKKQKSGHVLNVASMAGLVSSPHMTPYNMTKAAVVSLSESLRGELARHHVGVSALCPYFFGTNIARSARGGDETLRGLAQKMLDSSDLSPDDVARIALEGVDRNQLYILPHNRGRWMWLAKRWLPGLTDWLTPRIVDAQMKKAREAAATVALPSGEK